MQEQKAINLDEKLTSMPPHIAARGMEVHPIRAYIVSYRPDPRLCWSTNFTPINPEIQTFTDIRKRDKVLNYLQSCKINGQPLYIIHISIVEIKHYLSFIKDSTPS